MNERLPYLDALRVFAFALLIPYHVGMYYVTWDWHVKSPQASPALEPFMLLSSPWRLGLLFFVGGVAAQLLWGKVGSWGLMRDRSKRLLLPLVMGLFVVVVPQAYFELKTQAPQLLPGDGGYLDFWWAALQGERYCQGSDCLVLPTWNHLWFLPYLWLYALAAPLLGWLQRRPALQLPLWAWCLVPALPLVAMRWWVFPHFPSTHDVVHDLYNHLQYGWLFLCGWVSRGPWGQGFWDAAQRAKAPMLLAVLVAWVLLLSYYAAFVTGEPPELLRMAQRALWALMGWWAIVAACGWMQRLVPEDRPWLRAASGAVFCLYVLHQTVIVVLTQWLAPLALPWFWEAPLLVLLTFGVSLAAYLVLRRVPVLRVFFGISPGAAGSPRPAAPRGWPQARREAP